MRSRGKPKLPPPPSRPARWEYVFFPSRRGPHAHLSLAELQEQGWVIQSSSAGDKGQQMLLLRRPVAWSPEKQAVQE